MSRRIEDIVCEGLKEIVNLHELTAPDKFSHETKLIGKNGILDSLAFVSFIVVIEQKVNESFNAQISLSDERAFSQAHSPFRSLGSLVECIIGFLKEGKKL